jgi:hypothetical protein
MSRARHNAGGGLKPAPGNAAVVREAKASRPDGRIGGAENATKVQDIGGIKPVDRLDRKRGGAAKWVQGAIKRPGALHESLGVPEGEKIPDAKLEKAEKSSNPTLRKRAVLAETMKHFKH